MIEPDPLGRDPSPKVAKILAETDAYLKYGLLAKAAEHIKKAVVEDFDSIDAQEKLLVIQDKQGKAKEAVSTVARIIELALQRGDADRITKRMHDLAQRAPDHPLVTDADAA